jgi:plasmid stabilization system protein ParE
MMTYSFVTEAEDDLRDLLEWYMHVSAGSEIAVAADIQRFLDRICQIPTRYARVGRAKQGRDVRIGATSRKKVVILYEITATSLSILSVSHRSARRYPWRNRLR